MKTQATPRPWAWALSPKRSDGSWQLWSDHEKGIYNTWIANSKGESISSEESQANAELIVKAVNRDHLFDELLEKCEFLIEQVGLIEPNFEKVSEIENFIKTLKGEL